MRGRGCGFGDGGNLVRSHMVRRFSEETPKIKKICCKTCSVILSQSRHFFFYLLNKPRHLSGGVSIIFHCSYFLSVFFPRVLLGRLDHQELMWVSKRKSSVNLLWTLDLILARCERTFWVNSSSSRCYFRIRTWYDTFSPSSTFNFLSSKTRPGLSLPSTASSLSCPVFSFGGVWNSLGSLPVFWIWMQCDVIWP